MNIGATIQRLRKQKKYSQTEFGAICKLSQTSLSQIESGGKRPHEKNLIRICKALDISQAGIYVLSLTEEDVPKHNRKLYRETKTLIEKIFL